VLAERIKTFRPSSILDTEVKAKELRAKGYNVISFGAGIPDFDTPEHIKNAATQAMLQGRTKLTDAAGIPELRAAVCTKLKRDNGLDYEPTDIIICSGAKHALFNIMMVLVNPGDEVIIPSPFWVSYPEQVRLLGGVPVNIETEEATGFDLEVERLRSAVTPRTKVVIVNSPNNPTGAVFSRQVLYALSELAVERNLWIVSDETYEGLSFEGRPTSIGSFGPEMKARTLIVNSCSKTYAMTGWRIGYAAGPRLVVQAIAAVQGQVTVCPSSVGQWAAVEALTGPQDEARRMNEELDRRRRILMDKLNTLPGISCRMPQGTFYAFANIAGLWGRRTPDGQSLKGSVDVANFFLEHAHVAVVPGLDFGSDRHVRISFGVGEELIREGVDRMGAAISRLS
jgi:aspartate aminotransferase